MAWAWHACAREARKDCRRQGRAFLRRHFFSNRPPGRGPAVRGQKPPIGASDRSRAKRGRRALPFPSTCRGCGASVPTVKDHVEGGAGQRKTKQERSDGAPSPYLVEERGKGGRGSRSSLCASNLRTYDPTTTTRSRSESFPEPLEGDSVIFRHPEGSSSLLLSRVRGCVCCSRLRSASQARKLQSVTSRPAKAKSKRSIETRETELLSRRDEQ